MPIRDPEQGALIRQAFVPPPGYQFVEADYSQLEVRVSACYHRDRKLIRYIKDPTTDMHRDTAMQLFRLPADIAAYKSIRHCAKNKAVFAEFYGSYFVNVARDIWREITKPKGLKLPDGTPLLKHLNSLGIRYLKPPQSGSLPPKGKDAASYECMVEGWERTFWDEWFVEYRDWKRDWFETYTKLGYFDSFTGFRYRGHFQRNDVVNYPIQGSAFHCNLRSFYRIHQELRRLQMKSYLVAQIHDSILALVKTEELKRYLELAREIMVNELARDWTWVVVPMDVEFEVAPPGESWHKKTKHKG
jgi:DNA polymerase-1